MDAGRLEGRRTLHAAHDAGFINLGSCTGRLTLQKTLNMTWELDIGQDAGDATKDPARNPGQAAAYGGHWQLQRTLAATEDAGS